MIRRLGEGRWRGPAWIPRATPRRGMHFYEYRSVRYWSKEIDETLTEGRKKIIFLIRDIDRPAMAAAPVESCQYVAPRSPWGRFGSVVVACKRLRRMRRASGHQRPICEQ